MRIPEITSVDNTLRIYYNKRELNNKDITSLFGKLSSATIAKLKKIVKEKMIEDNIPSYGTYTINTNVAFDVWGIDVADLESRWKKISKLKLA